MSVVVINLLPYRDAKIRRRKSEFAIRMFLFAIVGVLISFLIFFYFQAQNMMQSDINFRLQSEISKLEHDNKKVFELQKDIEALNNRLKSVELLRKNRNIPLIIFNDLVNNGIEGFYINKIDKKGDDVTLEGAAIFAQKVSELLSATTTDRILIDGKIAELVSKEISLPNNQKRKISNFKITAKLNSEFLSK